MFPTLLEGLLSLSVQAVSLSCNSQEVLHPIPRPRARTFLRRHGEVNSLKGFDAGLTHHYHMVLVSLTSIAHLLLVTIKTKSYRACDVRVYDSAGVHFFQLFRSRHVSVLYRFLPSSAVLLKNRDANVHH